MASLVTSAVLMAVGGIAVFFHLEHWERIFNGFGNPTSGITQELVCIVVVAVLMVVAFVAIRKNAQEPSGKSLPRALAICMVVAAVVTVLVTGHSYMMDARPAWNSVLGPLSLVGAACALGPLTFAVIEAACGHAVGRGVAWGAVGGAVANVVLSGAYLFAMEVSGSAYTEVGYYIDPTDPTAGMVDVAALSPFAGESVAMVAATVIAIIVTLVCALAAHKSGSWKVWGSVGVAGAAVGAVALRMAFYSVGASVYLFY